MTDGFGEIAIQSNGLRKCYRRLVAVQSLNLSVPRGTIYGLLGPNGAGKTTAIMMLLGNVRPSAGSAAVLGKPIGNIAVRRYIGFLPEKFQFHEFLTAEEFLRLHGRLAGMERRRLNERIPEVLEAVGLKERARSRLKEFSKGMLQRIGLGQAILHEPELVVLDEPTSALDPLGRRDVRNIIHHLKEKGKTVLLNSHLLSEIEMTCDEVAILNRGVVVRQGKLSELLTFSSTVEMQVENINPDLMAAIHHISPSVSVNETHIIAWVDSEERAADLAAAVVDHGGRLLSLIPKRETLEELFVRVIEKS